jgi:hypothetical protein
MLKNTLKKLGVVLLGIGATVVSIFINAAVNAVGVWIVLEQFNYSLSGFWAYILVGLGLAIVLTPLAD